jgi:hypothetical protein
MEANELAAAKLRDELKVVEDKLKAVAQEGVIIRAKAAMIDDIEGAASHACEIEQLMEKPSILLADAVKEAASDLERFTRHSLEKWITDNYPSLEFRYKSLWKPLQDMLVREEVVLIKENVGRRTPSVYEFKRKTSAK